MGRAALFGALVYLLAACYETPKAPCAFLCGQGGECPIGYMCGGDDRCHQVINGAPAECEPLQGIDAGPRPDAAESVPDAPPATPDAPMIDVPDAAVDEPDAPVPDEPDAAVGEPDAPVPDEPDAPPVFDARPPADATVFDA